MYINCQIASFPTLKTFKTHHFTSQLEIVSPDMLKNLTLALLDIFLLKYELC